MTLPSAVTAFALVLGVFVADVSWQRVPRGASPGVEARVVDPSGVPIADVRAMSFPRDDARTDAQGQFQLSRAAALVRFSKLGYEPHTIATDAIKGDVVLRPSRQASWRPPMCPESSWVRFGDVMRFSASRGMHPILQSDEDYFTISIKRAGVTLIFGSGPLWTTGLPDANRLSEMVAVQERDVLTPWGDPAAEYRGRRAEGSMWREILMFGESIGYDRASAKAAAQFDAVIDSLCFRMK